MKYQRFEQLPVWRAAIELARQACALAGQAPLRRHRGLRDQMERAAVSISSHIAQGFEQGTTRELLACISLARGSAAEVRSMLCLLEGLQDFTDLKSQISDLQLQAEEISRQLSAWAGRLRPPRVAGEPSSPRKIRRPARPSHEHDAFREELRRIQQRFATDPSEES